MAERERTYSAVVTAVECYLPDRIVTNSDLEKIIDTSDTWIRERTGIRERRILDDQPTSFMAVTIAERLLRQRDVDPEEVDLIIVATVTPDMVFPATACLVQDRIGARRAWGFDLSAACSGFVYAVVTGSQFIESGAHKSVMVIGVDKMSAITDMEDRSTCVLFGDGGGGILLERSEDPDVGMVDFDLHADGSMGDDLYMKGGGSLHPASHETVDKRYHFLRQNGRVVYKQAIVKMAEVSLGLLERNGLTIQDLKLFIPHQANLRIINATARRMNLPSEKLVVNIDKFANTTAGTVPIALHEAWTQGRLERGDLVQLTAVGGGLTWGSLLLRWAY